MPPRRTRTRANLRTRASEIHRLVLSSNTSQPLRAKPIVHLPPRGKSTTLHTFTHLDTFTKSWRPSSCLVAPPLQSCSPQMASTANRLRPTRLRAPVTRDSVLSSLRLGTGSPRHGPRVAVSPGVSRQPASRPNRKPNPKPTTYTPLRRNRASR